ncbi:hypothetical protein ACGFZL_11640 [Streptomyces sp. NPDC048182]
MNKVTDTAGNIWTYGYDQRGRKTKAVDPDTGTATYTYTYDELDRPTSATDARGNTTTTVYVRCREVRLQGWALDW